MTGADIRKARATLGRMWGLQRPLHLSELGKLLKLRGDEPGQSVRKWEQGAPVTGPVERAIEAWLAGHVPDGLADALRELDGPR